MDTFGERTPRQAILAESASNMNPCGRREVFVDYRQRPHKPRQRILEATSGHQGVVQLERATGLKGRQVLYLGIGVPPDKFDAFIGATKVIGKNVQIDIVKNDKSVAGLSDKDATLITFGRTLYREHRVSSELWAKMIGHFGRQQTVQLMMIMGDYFRVGFMMNAADQHLPPTREALLPPLNR